MSTFYLDLLRQTGTITNRSDGVVANSYGVPAKTDADPITTAYYLEPIQETEQLVEAETYITTWRLFLPPLTPITAMALFADASDVVYQVLEVLPYTNARTGVQHHIECKLAQVQG